MKDRSKYVLEGALTELAKNEYDRYLAADELAVQVDSQVYLGSVTKEEGELCKKLFEEIARLKDIEIELLQRAINDIVTMERPAKEQESKQIEGQMSIDELSNKEE